MGHLGTRFFKGIDCTACKPLDVDMVGSNCHCIYCLLVPAGVVGFYFCGYIFGGIPGDGLCEECLAVSSDAYLMEIKATCLRPS